MRNYIGITIGPICDTLDDAATPAALWYASSIFSDITKRICEKLVGQDGFQEVKIYSPYYSETIKTNDGVGKFHDRIFFSTTSFEHDKLRQILEDVKKDTALNLPKELRVAGVEDFFRTYLQIHYVVKPENEIGNANCVLELSRYLDALELMKSFPKDDRMNPMRKLFVGEDESGNKYIKKSPLFLGVTDGENQLKKLNDQIRSIADIASWEGKIPEGLKRRDYYAVVSADGDGMGKFLEQLSSDAVTEFSEACLAYDEEAAKLIGGYGGMTIYAGGDDLLFLAPVMTENDDVFGLCNRIQELFQKKIREKELFAKMDLIPTISFGIAIRFMKFPLYEAFSASRYLLALAKSDGDFDKKECHKNNMLIGVQKHSGQSVMLMVSNDCYEEFKLFMKLDEDVQSEEKVIHSVLYTLDTFSTLITTLNQKAKKKESSINVETYQKAWCNLFDNEEQERSKSYIENICRTYYEKFVQKESKILVPKEGLRDAYNETGMAEGSLLTLIYILKLKQFLAEKGGRQ